VRHTQGVRNHKVGPPGGAPHEVLPMLLKHLAHRRTPGSSTAASHCGVTLHSAVQHCAVHGTGLCCSQRERPLI